MSLLKSITTGRKADPRRVLVYGVHGVGKSTFAAMADSPVFIQTEDGLGNVDAARFPLARSLGDVMGYLASLYDEHPYRTVAIDSLDWLERLIHADVCRQKNVDSIEDIGYGKGYAFALRQWREVLDALDGLRNVRGMTVVLIAHAQIEKFANPETETYDRYAPRLHRLASALVQEWCDEVLFATYRVHTRTASEGFDGERVLRTTERPAHVAKNRLALPDEIPLDYRVYAGFARGESVATPSSTET
jgi:hypothetical protein